MPDPTKALADEMAARRGDQPTIDEVREIQRRLGLLDTHVVWIGPASFVIAHTDEERATLTDQFGLSACPLHRWLWSEDGPPVKPGYYTVAEQDCDPVAPWFFADLPETPEEQ